MTHPIQDMAQDEHGIIRFNENKIVTYLLDKGPFDLNHLAMQNFSREDYEQFAQLIGYSVSGFGGLSYVSEETIETADRMAEGESEQEARNNYLREKIRKIKEAGKALAEHLFSIHPDDLEIK